MKNNSRKILYTSIILAVAILSCLGVLWLVDGVFNGAFKQWFYTLFTIDPHNQLDGRLGVLFKSWGEIKQFFIILFFVFTITLVLSMVVPAYLYARHRSNKELAIVTEAMHSFLASGSEELTLPKKYAEIETQLVKLKAISQKHQQLMKTEMQQKNDLITYLAHDLKTPLASVIGYLSLLDEAQDIPPEQRAKYVGISLSKAYRLEELINEFFEITRFNLQTIVINKGKIKLAFMLQQLTDEFYPMLAPQGKKAALHVREDIIINGDPDKLARVFNNILKNAIAYSYDNSVIDIAAAVEGEWAIITFTNRGDPIPPQRLDTIFEKFYRLDSARSTNTGGAGLGLAIAKGIVAAHGGAISAESSPECTIFSVKLPAGAVVK